MIDEATFVTLEKLSRRAALDSLAALGAHVDEEDRFDSLAVHLLQVGLRALERHDPSLSGADDDVLGVGVSPERYAFRAMRGANGGSFTNGPTIDWLRKTVCDARFEPRMSTSVTADGEMPEPFGLDAGDFHQAVLEASSGLSTRALWALHHLARRRAEGVPLRTIARRFGMSVGEARAELELLRVELGERARPGPIVVDLREVDSAPMRMEQAA